MRSVSDDPQTTDVVKFAMTLEARLGAMVETRVSL